MFWGHSVMGKGLFRFCAHLAPEQGWDPLQCPLPGEEKQDMAELQTVLISLSSLENWSLKAELTLLNSALTLWSIKTGHQG